MKSFNVTVYAHIGPYHDCEIEVKGYPYREYMGERPHGAYIDDADWEIVSIAGAYDEEGEEVQLTVGDALGIEPNLEEKISSDAIEKLVEARDEYRVDLAESRAEARMDALRDGES